MSSGKKRRLHAVKGACSCSIQAHPTTSDSAVQTGVIFSDCAVQTDMSMKTFSALQEEVVQLQVKNHEQQEEMKQSKMSEEAFKNDDEKVKYYTGLPTFAVLMTLFQFTQPFIPNSRTAMSKFQQCILVLARLRLNLAVSDLAYRFNISKATVSRTINSMVDAMFIRWQPLVKWPDHENLKRAMPLEFKATFGTKVAVIIDCFEIFIDRPSNLLARAQTWSSYKHHNTAKYLIGCCPQGAISFISKGWGGRVSNKHLTENCGLLTKLLPGDIVHVDRGFDIQDSVGMMCAELIIPASTKGKTQLTTLDVGKTRKRAHLRIHVERVLGVVRQKYTILQGPVPIDYLMSKVSEKYTTMDKVVFVCCALSNLCESVILFQ